jgi:ADP-ribose pyrophosphatase YjhB (NUDIX family)
MRESSCAVAGTSLGVVDLLVGLRLARLRVVGVDALLLAGLVLAVLRLLVLLWCRFWLIVHRSIVADVGELDGWRFCPRCGGELEPGVGRVECRACGFVAYANPKPTASALVVDEAGRILLTRRAIEPFKGDWDLPGGFVDEGEHPLDAVRRELREETGLEVEPLEFFGVFMDRYGGDSTAQSTLNLLWTARVVGGEANAADDVDELGWFGPDELPAEDELAFAPNVAEVLSAWRGGHQHP